MELFDNIFVRNVPVLLLLVPLVGLFTVSLSKLFGGAAVERTLRSNVALNLYLGAFLLVGFLGGPIEADNPDDQLARLVSRLPIDFLTGQAATVAESRSVYFLVDGINFIPILLVLILAPAVISLVSNPEHPRAAAPRWLLAWQLVTLAVLLAGDLLTLAGALLLATVGNWILLAATRARTMSGLDRRTRGQLLGTLLAIGGLIGVHATATVYLSYEQQSWNDAGFHRLFLELEAMINYDAESLVRYRQGTQWCGVLILLGGFLRLGCLPLQQATATRPSDDPFTSLIHWIDGPVVSLVVIWRGLQLVPTGGIDLLAQFAPWLCGFVVWFGLAAGQSLQRGERSSLQELQLRALLGLALCSANMTAYAGAVCLLCAVPLRLAFAAHRRGFWFQSAAVLMHLFAGVCLWGVLRGSGAGGAAPLMFLLASLAYLYGQRSLPVQTETGDVTLWGVRQTPSSTSNGSERAVWEAASSDAQPPALPAALRGFPLLTLQVSLLALLVPQWVWVSASRELAFLPFSGNTKAVVATEIVPPDISTSTDSTQGE